MIRTPANLEVLLHCYWSPSVHPHYKTSSYISSVTYLLSQQMIKCREQQDTTVTTYEVTERGEFYIKHLMSIPFPVSKWEIPNE